MADILVKNVDVELLKKQSAWLHTRCENWDSVPDADFATGLCELVDNIILNVEEKEYLVTRTASAVVSALSPEDARASFAYRVARNMVDEDTTVEEN